MKQPREKKEIALFAWNESGQFSLHTDGTWEKLGTDNKVETVVMENDILSQKEPEAWYGKWKTMAFQGATLEKQADFIRSLLHITRKEVRESTDREARKLCEIKTIVLLSSQRTQTIEEIKKLRKTYDEVTQLGKRNERWVQGYDKAIDDVIFSLK